MGACRHHRILRQHVHTDQLLGIEAVAGPGQVPVAKVGPGAKTQLLEELDVNEVRPCTQCPLYNGRQQTVFGEGNPDAQLMFVGEGPGKSEDEQGRPFVGRAGELLNKQIQAMGLQREQVYIANIVKCRPPNNRTPTPAEAQTCSAYLRRQIKIIEPRVIVTLGSPAAKLLLNTPQGITSIRGSWYHYTLDGDEDMFASQPTAIPVMPTFHPAYLLRAYTEDNRRYVWSDLQKVMELLGLKKPS